MITPEREKCLRETITREKEISDQAEHTSTYFSADTIRDLFDEIDSLRSHIVDLKTAATRMVEAYTPDHENEWMYMDGWGQTRRRSFEKDDRVRNELKKAIEQYKC